MRRPDEEVFRSWAGAASKPVPESAVATQPARGIGILVAHSAGGLIIPPLVVTGVGQGGYLHEKSEFYAMKKERWRYRTLSLALGQPMDG